MKVTISGVYNGTEFVGSSTIIFSKQNSIYIIAEEMAVATLATYNDFVMIVCHFLFGS